LTGLLNSIPTSDWKTVLVACILLVLLLAAIELINKRLRWNRSYLRKFVHIIVGLLICITSLQIKNSFPILLISGFFIIFNLWAIRTHHLKSIHINEQSYGTVYYPLSIFILALVLWSWYKEIFLISILIMTVPDALAGIIGMRFARKFFVIITEKKSLVGAITMFISSMPIVSISLYSLFNKSISFSLAAGIMISIAITAAELLSHRGSDNLSVPLMTAILMFGFLQHETILNPLSLGIVLAVTVSILSYKVNFLDLSGAGGAFLLGLIIFGFGGWLFTIPIMIFYISSSALSIIGKRRKKKFASLFEKTGRRDIYQVLANGGIPGILVLLNYFNPAALIYYMYLAALATATADTWATEIGIFSRSRPWLITNLNRVEPGRSGAISGLGSLAALCGSALIAFTGVMTSPQANYSEWLLIFTITFAGFAGNFIDSICGASFQAQFRCGQCGKHTERKIHCTIKTDHISGLLIMNNDFVNFFSISCGAFFLFGIYHYFF